ncbi:hypothetical protein [Listeria ilorinensis]|uniref:hypothetical protein n=1 Tax=Listeria ilorinensis TaxID=2867439 RepID=UPI001EF6F209|nr:hypothetical protein [Listeria ilorinensis]
MTKIMKMIQSKEDGSKEQFYPATHAAAITGLDERITGKLATGVTSVNRKTGAVTLASSDIGAAEKVHTHSTATSTTAGFMSAADKQKLDGLAETGGVTEAGVWALLGGYVINLEEIGEVN